MPRVRTALHAIVIPEMICVMSLVRSCLSGTIPCPDGALTPSGWSCVSRGHWNWVLLGVIVLFWGGWHGLCNLAR
jgi:hypothetical protein